MRGAVREGVKNPPHGAGYGGQEKTRWVQRVKWA
jgi:hypothetical protein